MYAGRTGNNMARYWKAFETQEDRKAWEKEQAKTNPNFKVCMRFPARAFEKDMHMNAGQLDPFRFVTVYRLDFDPVKGY